MGEGEICKVELVRKGDVRVFFASSSEVYGDAEVFPTPESYEGKVDPLVLGRVMGRGRGPERLYANYAEGSPKPVW